MSSDGTPLEAIESGDVANAADSSRMQAILRDMGSTGADDGPRPPITAQRAPMDPNSRPPMDEPQRPQMTPQMIQQMQMMKQQQMQQQMMQQQQGHPMPPQYADGDQNDEQPESAPADSKKNIWSTVLEQIRDPLFVVIIFFVLSLPVFHTFLAKYAEWAFAVGGQLSMLGLITLSLVAGIIMAILRGVSNIAGF